MTASNAMRPTRHCSALAFGARLLVATAVTLPMVGCGGMDDPTRVAGWTLIDSAQRHPILVSQEPTAHLIGIRRGSNGLSTSQRAELLNFAAHFRATDSGNSRLIVAVPSGGANEVAAMYAVGEIRSLLTDQGFGESSISVEAYQRRGRQGSADPRLVHALRGRAAAVRRLVDQPRLRPDEHALPEPRLRSAAQPRRHGRQSGRPARAAQRDAAFAASAAIRSGASTSGVTPPAPARASTSA